jgi:hypothetical protein
MMSTNSDVPIKVCLFYAHEDEDLLEKLARHLSGLNTDEISIWDARNIDPGRDRTEEINTYLNTADLILLLISSDFISSDECDKVMLRALKQQNTPQSHVIPIILRPGHYKDEPFSNLQALPRNGKAITTWPNADEAFSHVVTSVREMANEGLVAVPQCTNKTNSNHNAGDKADSVEVTVNVTCTSEVYDKQEAEKIVANLLRQEATQDFGTNYALVNTIRITITRAKVEDANKGTVSLTYQAAGLWAYQFDTIQKQNLAKLIAGKPRQTAIDLLKQQIGVSEVQIEGGAGNLPTEHIKITIEIRPV